MDKTQTGTPVDETPDPLEQELEAARQAMATAGMFGTGDAEEEALDDDDEEDLEAEEVTDSEDSGDASDDDEEDGSERSPDGEADDEPEAESEEPDPASSEEDAEPAEEELPRRAKKLKAEAIRLQKENKTLLKRLEKIEAEQATQEEKLLAKLREQQDRAKQLELEADARAIEDRQAEQVVAEMVGTRDEVNELIDRTAAGDAVAAARLQEIRRNQARLNAMMAHAKRYTERKSAEVYREAADGLENVNRKVLDDANLDEVIKHLHAAGVVTGEAASKAEIDRLNKIIAERDDAIEDLQSQLTQDRPKRAATSGARRPQVPAGRPLAKPKPKSPFDDLYGDDGMPKAGAKFSFFDRAR